MILSISIILGIAFILNLIQNEGDYNVLILAALIISVWESCLPLAIILIVLGVILGLMQLNK